MAEERGKRGPTHAKREPLHAAMKPAPSPTRRKKKPTRKSTDAEKAADRLRKREQRHREQHRKDLVALVFPDDEKSKPKSKLQIQNEALLELREEILLLASKGKSPRDIAVELNLHTDTTHRLLAESLEQMMSYFSQASPRENFCRYAAFNMNLIRKLDDLITDFTDDKENRQYNAATTAIRTQSELYDKLIQRGASLGIIQERKEAKETSMPRSDLLEALRTERSQMDSLIAELEITVTERTTKMVARDGRTVTRGAFKTGGTREIKEKGASKGVGASTDEERTVIEVPEAEGLALEIVGERAKKRARIPLKELEVHKDPDSG